jgi:hypothetical protein
MTVEEGEEKSYKSLGIEVNAEQMANMEDK